MINYINNTINYMIIINILTIVFFRIDWDKLIFRSKSSNPQVDFIGDYKLEGKILILPIRGEGRCNISMRKYYNVFFLYCILIIACDITMYRSL